MFANADRISNAIKTDTASFGTGGDVRFLNLFNFMKGSLSRGINTLRSIARFSVSAPSHHNPFSAVFTTNIAESNFRYTQANFGCD